RAGGREAGSPECGGTESRPEAQDRRRGAASRSREGTRCGGGTVVVPRSRLARVAGRGGASRSRWRQQPAEDRDGLPPRAGPAPPMVAKGSKSKEEPFAFGDEDPGQARGDAARSKQAEKDRKKKEQAREREEKARRKALRGPGLVVRMFQAVAQPRRAIALLVL